MERRNCYLVDLPPIQAVSHLSHLLGIGDVPCSNRFVYLLYAWSDSARDFQTTRMIRLFELWSRSELLHGWQVPCIDRLLNQSSAGDFVWGASLLGDDADTDSFDRFSQDIFRELGEHHSEPIPSCASLGESLAAAFCGIVKAGSHCFLCEVPTRA